MLMPLHMFRRSRLLSLSKLQLETRKASYGIQAHARKA